ncbi:MAG TPA: hypothetical protein VID73_11405 [Ktedonobacterales bacterium]
MADFFARNLMSGAKQRSAEEGDAELGTLLLRYLRHHHDGRAGAWVADGRDPHETLRRTCNAAEVLHRLDLDGDSATMVRGAGDWLINLPGLDRRGNGHRDEMRLYPSRFKALAYIGRFFDGPEVNRSFLELLEREQQNLDIAHHPGESRMLGACVVLDTLLQLDRTGRREELCSAREFTRIRDRIVRKLHTQLKAWIAVNHPVNGRAAARRSDIENARDLSYVLGLLLETGDDDLLESDAALIKAALLKTIHERDRLRATKATFTLYAALQLADHYQTDTKVSGALEKLLAELRQAYATSEPAAADRANIQRWDLIQHTQVLRLLISQYRNAGSDGMRAFTRAMVSHFVRDVENAHAVEGDSFHHELEAAVRNHLTVRVDSTKKLSGGFSDDQVYRVTFASWFPALEPNPHHQQHTPNTSLIIKRSTRDAFERTAENYRRLPQAILDAFVAQPSPAYVQDSGETPTYYLVMEDLTTLFTLRHLFNEFDNAIMVKAHKDLLRSAALLTCEVVFKLFRQPESMLPAPTSQIAKLYTAPVEKKVTQAVGRLPWLKSLLKGFPAGRYRFKPLDHYLSLMSQHADVLQPRFLGITHNDFHARNIMLDDDCTRVKLIDLDKIERAGDYLLDIATMLQDLCVYRRVTEPEREFGLPFDQVLLGTNVPTGGRDDTPLRMPYPALGRQASRYLQEVVLREVEQFAKQIGDVSWKPRLWLATASTMLSYLNFQTQREPAAVLFGEGIRLLDELAGHLEHQRALPDVLFPEAWPERIITPTDAIGDLPEWCQRSPLLREVHARMLALGLQPGYAVGAVRYFAGAESGEPVAVLAAHHGALARIKLRHAGAEIPATKLAVRVVNAERERLPVTADIIEDTAGADEVLALVAAVLAPALAPKRAAVTRRRG